MFVCFVNASATTAIFPYKHTLALHDELPIFMNAFKVAGQSSDDINFWSNLAAGLFILPFFLFSASAGQWAEKNEKSGLIRTIKLLEVVIMGLAAVGFWLGSLPVLLGVLFLMGLQRDRKSTRLNSSH